MRGYLKCSSIIHQCLKCWALRDMFEPTDECLSCRRLLNINYNEVRPLAFGDVSNDVMPATVVIDTNMRRVEA